MVIILFLKLYFKIKSADKNSINLVEFPKETNQRISNFINDTQANNKELKDFLINEHKDAKKIITEVDEKIAPFEKVAREKNDELKEYKKGYEYSRNKALLDGIIETITFIENAEGKINSSDEIAKSYFSSTKDKLLIILNNSGIEVFNPNHPFGVKGVGESNIVPPLGAVSHAVYNAIGKRIYDLPINPEAIIRAINGKL